MHEHKELAGRKVLVLQSSYFQALDLAQALQRDGAEVLGPCSDEAEAMDLVRREMPTHAVLGLDFGNGPSFEVAHFLRKCAVPLVFLTGYDGCNVPREMRDTPLIQKPVAPDAVARAVAKLPKFSGSGVVH